MSSDEAPRSIRKEAISSPGQGSRKRGITATENTNTTADTEKRQKKRKDRWTRKTPQQNGKMSLIFERQCFRMFPLNFEKRMN